MENLDVQVKNLADENEQLKKENSRLLTRIETLELEVSLFERNPIGKLISLPL